MTLCWLLMATWMGALPSASWQEEDKKESWMKRTFGVDHRPSRQPRTWPGTSLTLPRTPDLTMLVSVLHGAPSSGHQRTLHLLQPPKKPKKHPIITIMMVYLPKALLQLGCTQFNCTWCIKSVP